MGSTLSRCVQPGFELFKVRHKVHKRLSFLAASVIIDLDSQHGSGLARMAGLPSHVALWYRGHKLVRQTQSQTTNAYICMDPHVCQSLLVWKTRRPGEGM